MRGLWRFAARRHLDERQAAVRSPNESQVRVVVVVVAVIVDCVLVRVVAAYSFYKISFK